MYRGLFPILCTLEENKIVIGFIFEYVIAVIGIVKSYKLACIGNEKAIECPGSEVTSCNFRTSMAFVTHKSSPRPPL